ncbi:MAG: sensor domain-containing diguanylate cyclase [Methylococcaceae bacterium]
MEEDLTTQVVVLESHMDSFLGFYKKNKDNAHNLQEFTKELLNLNSLSVIIQHILENARYFFNIDVISLCLIDEKGEIAKLLNDDGFDWENNQGLMLLNSNELLTSTFSVSAHPYIGLYEGSKYSIFFEKFHIKPVSIAVTLLNRRDKYLGALTLGSYDPHRFIGTMAFDLVERMSSIITVCLENNLNFETMQRTSFIDTLTGVNNRRFFEQRINEELDRCQRNGEPVSCLFLDIDFFKSVNDTYGHQGGDLVLSLVAAAIKTQMRGNDVLVRYGGEEFVALLSAISENMAFDIAERIRKTVEALRIELNDATIAVTISIGSATYIPGSEKCAKKDVAEQLIKLSDAALYAAKHNGRNRVENGGVFSTLHPTTRR